VRVAHPSLGSINRLRCFVGAVSAWLLASAIGCSSSPDRDFESAAGAAHGGAAHGGTVESRAGRSAGGSGSLSSALNDAGEGGASGTGDAAGESNGNGDAGSNAASAGGGVVNAGGSVVGAGGRVAGAGGSAAGAGGSAAGAGGSVVSAGGSVVSAGGSVVSAGSTGAGGACTPVPWFPDADGDDFGRTAAQVSACAAPTSGKWVSKGGDCNDENASVFPQQKAYQSDGYPVSGGVSFDYDCSGQEQIEPSQLGAAPACSGLALLNCAGSGFAKTDRTGPGVNPLCGSRTLVTCAVKDALFCEGATTQMAEGVRCR